MFAQVIRYRVKPDSWERLGEFNERWQAEQAPTAPGFKGSLILREQRAPDRCIMVVLFESHELAKQNSARPETNQWYQKLLTVIDGEPEFIDTDVFRSSLT